MTQGVTIADATVSQLAQSDEGAVVCAELACLASPDVAAVGRRVAVWDEIVLGRAATGAERTLLVDRDTRASRSHARICVGVGGATIEDLGSKNGTFVNGVRLAAGTHPLSVLDVVRVGDTLFEFAHRIEPKLIDPPPDFVALAPRFADTVASLSRLATIETPVLLVGESGTGKEVLARYLHAACQRPGEFVAVNCAAVTDSLFESLFFGHTKGAFTGAGADASGLFGQAKNGTLFLDEIGEMPLNQQAKLLRVLETGTYQSVGSQQSKEATARVVAATNVRVDASESFRRDLFARLSAGLVRLPPLRERREDLLELLRRFLDEQRLGAETAARQVLASVDVQEQLFLYPWPLNVRELRAFALRLGIDDTSGPSVQRAARDVMSLQLRVPSQPVTRSADTAVATASPSATDVPTPQRSSPDSTTAVEPSISRNATPSNPPAAASSRDAMLAPEPAVTSTRTPRQERMTQERFVEALKACQGNIYKLSQDYGWHRRQIYRWLKLFGLNADDFRDR